MSIGLLFNKYKSDKNVAHSYGPLYDELLAPYRDTAVRVLEVGVQDGCSMWAWRDYFPNAQITGLDHYAHIISDDRIQTYKADSTNKDQVDAALRVDFDLRPTLPMLFDVVVDDGCHWIKEQTQTWENLWDYLRPGGLWVIEDVQRIDEAAPVFEPLGFTMRDLRSVKDRGDDVVAYQIKG